MVQLQNYGHSGSLPLRMAPKKDPITQTLEDVQTVVKENVLVQYASIVPVLAISMWLFGFYYTWGTLLTVAIGFSMRYVAHQKGNFYQRFSTTSRITHNKREIQHCAWLNLLVRKYYTTCVPRFLDPVIADVNQQMNEKKPAFMVRPPPHPSINV